jgi:hypothetical protein
MKREGVKRESLIAEGLPTEAKLVQFGAPGKAWLF